MIEVGPESCLSGGKLLKLVCPCVGCLSDHNSTPTVRRQQGEGDTKTSLQDSGGLSWQTQGPTLAPTPNLQLNPNQQPQEDSLAINDAFFWLNTIQNI